MTQKINQAVILASDFMPFIDDMPQAMYPIHDRPFIDYLLEQISNFGIQNVIILLGYLPDMVVHYVSQYNKYHLNINYDITPIDCSIKDRLLHAKRLLDDTFLFMYGDRYCPIDYDKLIHDFYDNKANIQLSIYNNYDRYVKNNIKMVDNRIVQYDNDLLGMDIGYAIVKRNTLEFMNYYDTNIYSQFANHGLYGTRTEHRYYSIDSFDMINLTKEFFKDKKVAFLDRDGTLNKKAPRACYIESPEEFIWLDGAMEAVKILKDEHYTTILVTNQPGIARGNLDIDTLNRIHDKMQNDLRHIGASIDYIYYCPHNWDDGCDCRKPKPGMLYQAQKDLSLNLTKCILFGDDSRDIEAAQQARCQYQLVSEKEPLIKAVRKLCKKNHI